MATSSESNSRVVYKNLDTSFVNLWALLRYLSQRDFVGRVHVELKDYVADVFLNGTQAPLLHEVDHASASDVTEEAALHRLVLRVRESPGSISVFEQASPAQSEPTEDMKSSEGLVEEITSNVITPVAATPESMRSATQPGAIDSNNSLTSPILEQKDEAASESEWKEMLGVSGELIDAVERAATASGLDFSSLLHDARVGLADDYAFLDPMTRRLRYEDAVVTLSDDVSSEIYVTGVSELLRLVVNKFASGEMERRRRERVALELARVARKHSSALARTGFSSQLDHIAGTKVI